MADEDADPYSACTVLRDVPDAVLARLSVLAAEAIRDADEEDADGERPHRPLALGPTPVPTAAVEHATGITIQLRAPSATPGWVFVGALMVVLLVGAMTLLGLGSWS